MVEVSAWHDFLVAVSLVLVIEGLLPFIKPERWRQMMVVIAQQPDETLRKIGLVSMLVGVGLLYVVR